MPNPRFIKTAQRWKNDRVPEARKQNSTKGVPSGASDLNFNSERITYSFLEGGFGKQVLDEYNLRASRDYNGASALNVLTYSDDVVKGSNPFAFALLDKILREKGMWVARPVDLEGALRTGTINLKDTYGDSALVLRSENDPNEYLARDLTTQVKSKGNIQYPVMIPLTGIDLRNDSNSPNGLSFNLTGFSNLVHAPQFDHSNDYKKFNEGDNNGLPIFDENGTRTLYAENGGLRRLYRSRCLDLDSRNRSLADSNENGRVIVCAEGTAPKK